MTVSTTYSQETLIYSGPGDYDYTFPVFDDSELLVHHVQTNGAEILLALGTDYTVALNPDGTGTLTVTYDYPSGGPYTGNIRMRRDLPIVQLTDWINSSAFDMDILEMDFDKVIMIIQELNTKILEGLTPEEQNPEVINTNQLRGRYTSSVGNIENIPKGSLPLKSSDTGSRLVGFYADGTLAEFDVSALGESVKADLSEFWVPAGGWSQDDGSGTPDPATYGSIGKRVTMDFVQGGERAAWVVGTTGIRLISHKTKDWQLTFYGQMASDEVSKNVRFRIEVYKYPDGSNNKNVTPNFTVSGSDFTVPDGPASFEYTPFTIPMDPAEQDELLIQIAVVRIGATADDHTGAVQLTACKLEAL